MSRCDSSLLYDDNGTHGEIHSTPSTGLMMEQSTEYLEALAFNVDVYNHEPLDGHRSWEIPQQPHADPHEGQAHSPEVNAATTTGAHSHNTAQPFSANSHLPGATAAHPVSSVDAPTTALANGACGADATGHATYRNARKRGWESHEDVSSSASSNDSRFSAESQSSSGAAAPSEATPNGDAANAPIIESFETAMTVSDIRDVENYLSTRGTLAEASDGCLTNSPCDYAALKPYMLRAEQDNGWKVVTGVMNGTIVTPPTHCTPLPWVKSNLLEVLFSEREVLALGMLPLMRLACREDTAKVITRSVACDDEPRSHVFHIFDSESQLAITNEFFTAYRWRTKSGEIRNLVFGTSKVVNGRFLQNPCPKFSIPIIRVCVNWVRSAKLEDMASLPAKPIKDVAKRHPHRRQCATRQAIYDHCADQVLSVFLIALVGMEGVLGFSYDDLVGMNLAESGPFVNVDWRDLLIACEHTDYTEGESSDLRFVVRDVKGRPAAARLALLGIDPVLKQFGGPDRSTFSLYPDIATIGLLEVSKLGKKMCNCAGANEGTVIVI